MIVTHHNGPDWCFFAAMSQGGLDVGSMAEVSPLLLAGMVLLS
jgi:hypothetical protein